MTDVYIEVHCAEETAFLWGLGIGDSNHSRNIHYVYMHIEPAFAIAH